MVAALTGAHLSPAVRGGRQVNNGQQRFQGNVKGMHGKGAPLETIWEAKQMGCAIYRRCLSSLVRHDTWHHIHLSLRISNGDSSTSDWKLTGVHSASDQNKPRSSAACKNTKEGRLTLPDQWASVMTLVGRGVGEEEGLQRNEAIVL